MGLQQERDVIRNLAATVAKIAGEPCQKEKIDAWKALNELAPVRPMIWITEIPWGEFEQEVEALRCVCVDPRLRSVENSLRRTIFTAQNLPCDEVVDDVWYVAKRIEGAGYGITNSEQQLPQGKSYIQSHHYEPVIKELEDIGKIRMPEVFYNHEATEEVVAFHRDLFGDALRVESCGVRQHFFAAWDQLVCWTGVTEALMDLVMRPDFIHAVMRRMTDSFLLRMEQFAAAGLLEWPHPLARVGSGAAGYTDELPRAGADRAHIGTLDQWGGAAPQIFSDVSPEMHEEFALAYEIEIMERCGLNYYGCCEPLHNKMALMAKIPRLRKISVSPWCDVAKTRERAARPYVFSHKPNPAMLAEDHFNGARAEQDIRDRLERSGDMPCEFIMKDISTVRGDVDRVIAWCEIASRVAREAAERHA